MPLVGDRVGLAPRPHRSLRRYLRRRLFASAPAHAPAASSRRPTASPLVVHPRPRRPPPSNPLIATLIAAASGCRPCRHGDRTGSGAVCGRGCAHCAVPDRSLGAGPGLSIYTCLFLGMPAKANYLDHRVLSLRVGISETAKKSRFCASPNRQISLFAGRGPAPRAGGWRPRPRFCKWCARV